MYKMVRPSAQREVVAYIFFFISQAIERKRNYELGPKMVKCNIPVGSIVLELCEY